MTEADYDAQVKKLAEGLEKQRAQVRKAIDLLTRLMHTELTEEQDKLVCNAIVELGQ